jgi:hypothetical protein
MDVYLKGLRHTRKMSTELPSMSAEVRKVYLLVEFKSVTATAICSIKICMDLNEIQRIYITEFVCVHRKVRSYRYRKFV